MSNTPWYLDALKQGVEAAENMNIHPNLKQAAIDQGICQAGYDAPITPIDGCCADKCKVFLDGSYRRGCKDTVDKVLELIDNECRDEENGKIIDRSIVYIKAQDLYKAVKELKSERADGND